jgi:hypothetical protein
VIAEGIETQEQLGLLQSWHCAEGQGYLFSRPVPAAQFAQLLQLGITETSSKVSGFMTDADKQLGRRTIRVEDESRFAILMPPSSTCQRNVTDSEMVTLSFTPSNR